MRMKDPLWFHRLGDVPGIGYATPAGLDVTRLPHRDARPTVYRPELDGYPDLPPSLSWNQTSRAPAADHLLEDPRPVTTARVLRNLAEALELPGEPADYHFAIQGVLGLLWFRRATEPEIFAEVERLGWLDLQLIEACPDTISYQHRDGGTQFFSVEAFDRLMMLYLTEGAIADAARVLPVAERFGAGDSATARRTRERAAAFAAEDAGR